MAATKLTFTAEGSRYVSNYTSKGEATINIERAVHGTLTVLAKLTGMNAYVPVWATDMFGAPNQIISVNVPAGVMVRIESATEVTNAKILHADA